MLKDAPKWDANIQRDPTYITKYPKHTQSHPPPPKKAYPNLITNFKSQGQTSPCPPLRHTCELAKTVNMLFNVCYYIINGSNYINWRSVHRDYYH